MVPLLNIRSGTWCGSGGGARGGGVVVILAMMVVVVVAVVSCGALVVGLRAGPALDELESARVSRIEPPMTAAAKERTSAFLATDRFRSCWGAVEPPSH